MNKEKLTETSIPDTGGEAISGRSIPNRWTSTMASVQRTVGIGGFSL
jgi:hypothetical protein